MYRINLYREFSEKRSKEARQRYATAAFAGLVAVEALLVISLMLGAILLKEQTAGLGAEVSRLETLVAAQSLPPPYFELAGKLVAVRQNRVEWYPKLSALSCRLEPSLMLLEVTGQTADGGRQGRFELSGVIRTGGSQVDPLSKFTTALRNEAAVVEDFPEVSLDIVEGGSSGRFKIVCQAARTAP